jgi:hypothetical protein
MHIKSVDELKVAFIQWRRKKRCAKESIPDSLIITARELAAIHGFSAIFKATGLPRRRICRGMGTEQSVTIPTPAYSRVEIMNTNSGTARPIAEVEVLNGTKLRIFSITPETISLLSSFCGSRNGA